MIFEHRAKEKKILLTIDRLVQLLVEASSEQEEAKGNLLDTAVHLIEEIHPLLLELVDARDEHMEPLIRQLILQKLPQRPVLNSFGQLQNDLNTVLRVALSLPPQNNSEVHTLTQKAALEVSTALSPDEPDPLEQAPSVQTVAPEPGFVEPERQEPRPETKKHPELDAILAQYYHGLKIETDGSFRSIKFDFYLPQIKTALVYERPYERTSPIHKSMLTKSGITLISISPDDLANPWQLIRRLPRVK